MTNSPGTVAVVVPVYNEPTWIGRCVDRVVSEIERSSFALDRVVIVDDGSTDGTAEEVDRLARSHQRVEVVHQANSGRFLARRAGLERVRSDFVLLVDSRVLLEDGSLQYLADHLTPDAVVWNGHVEVLTDGNPFATFWDTMTKIAWSEYFSEPRLTHFGLERFDHYPKGTGCFFAPREVLERGFAQFSTYFDDLRNASDDTSLIRDIASTRDIWISPGFGCSYVSRSTLRLFVSHAFQRGTFFVDGHLRRGARFAPVIVAFVPLSVLAMVVAALEPLLGVAMIVSVFLFAAAATAAKRQPARAILVVGMLAPLFVAVYGFGIWRGLALVARSRFR
ncbi:MAG TPA: glycosyltransferase family 2 protein [Acidimicrobiales bacterium]|nr:glycosyltransferase family 2 protein [Acidimicrobiales bacterium]